MSAPENFRTNVREAMRLRGFTQESLAETAKIHRVNINRILNARVDPSINTCERIASALGFELHELLQPPKKFSHVMLTSV